MIPQLEAILAHIVIQKEKYRPKPEILMKCADASTEDATWENE